MKLFAKKPTVKGAALRSVVDCVARVTAGNNRLCFLQNKYVVLREILAEASEVRDTLRLRH